MNQFEETLELQSQQISAYRANLPVTLIKLSELGQQKKVLGEMLARSQQDLVKAKEYMKKLLPRHQPKSILKNGKGHKRKASV